MENQTTAETGDALIKDVATLKQDAAKIAHDVKAHAHAHVDQTKKRFQDAVSATRAHAAAHPFAILGFGLALGYIFGARRGRRRS